MIVAISCQGKFADVAESEAMQISLHPDDPPWGLLGSAINRTPVLIIRIVKKIHAKVSMESSNSGEPLLLDIPNPQSDSHMIGQQLPRATNLTILTNCPGLPTAASSLADYQDLFSNLPSSKYAASHCKMS